MTAIDVDEAAYLALVERIADRDPSLSALAAGLLAAAQMGLVKDSRSFAQGFDVAHALVLRALTELVAAGRIAIVQRDARSQRTIFSVTE